MAFDGKQIRSGSIAGAKLVNSAITSVQLADDAVSTAKIQALAVDATKLGTDAVIEAKIAANAVSTDKLAAGAVTAAKLAASAVSGDSIADGSVTLAKLAADSVDSSKIVAGSITGGDIASNTVAATNLVTTYEATLLYHDGTRPMSGTLDLGTSNKITNLANPEQAQDAATKAYVDSVTSGLDLKASVRVATTEEIVLDNTTPAVDGVTLADGNRVLVKNQGTASQNGIWVVSTTGAWARAIDANSSAEVTSGLFTFVEEGTANANTGWVLTTDDPIALTTTPLTFTQFSGAGSYLAGFGLVLTGNSFAVSFNDTDGTVTAVAATQEAGSSNFVARADHSHALADAAVTTTKIADDAVTAAKLESVYEATLFLIDGTRALTGDLQAGTKKIVGLADPTLDQDAATKAYVDAQITVTGGVSTSTNKNMTASVTAADGALACATAIASDAKGYVQVFVNGIKVDVAGDKTGDCYFSTDGTVAKALNSVVLNDSLYWNGSVAGYELAITDTIDFDYITTTA